MRELDTFETMFGHSRIFDKRILSNIVGYFPKLRTAKLLFEVDTLK